MSAWFEGVTPEQFRADSNFYDAEHHGYRSISGPGIGIQPRLEPVSYTHLDVYKRQSWYILISSYIIVHFG